MRQVFLDSDEINWLLSHGDFRNNESLYQKLLSSVRNHEVLIRGSELYLIELRGDKVSVSEKYEISDEFVSDQTLMGFVTSEQYFTDPGMKKIHFSDKGFIFFTNWDSIFILNLENSEIQKTSYREIKSEDNEIFLSEATPFVRLGQEVFWSSGKSDNSHFERIEAARKDLSLSDDQFLCPQCYSEPLTEIKSEIKGDLLGCEICELLFKEEPYGLVSSK